MKSIIFTSGYSEGDDELASIKGHRSDVFYRDDDGHYFELNFITLERLAFDLKGNMEKGVDHFADPGMIVLAEISKDSIVKAISILVERNFFTTQKHLTVTPDAGWSYFDFPSPQTTTPNPMT